MSVLRVITLSTETGSRHNQTVIFTPEQLEKSKKVPFFLQATYYLEIGLSVVFVQLYALVQLCFYRLSEN
jgi:hypothetical protein